MSTRSWVTQIISRRAGCKSRRALSGCLLTHSPITLASKCADMKEAIIHPSTKVEIRDSAIPLPNPNEVVTKVVVSGSNPKDWKGPEWTGQSINQGDDIAGIVHAVGDDVVEFKPGDRVAALHPLRTRGGSYAEYAVSPACTTFHLPKKTSFEEGASIPLAALTAAVALYARLNLASPWLPEPRGQRTPLVIYGASSAVGSYAVQFARRSNIHPLICIAGNSKDHVEQFIDRAQGDTVLDYRNGDAALVEGMRAALPPGKPLELAFDAVSDETSSRNICEVLHQTSGKIALVLPANLSTAKVPSAIQQSYSNVMDVHKDLQDFGFVFTRLLAKGLEDGWFVPQPHEVVPGGLNGVEGGLRRLRDGKARAVKYVFRIADTPGLGT